MALLIWSQSHNPFNSVETGAQEKKLNQKCQLHLNQPEVKSVQQKLVKYWEVVNSGFFRLWLSSQYLRPWQTWARKKRALFKKRETLSKSCTIKNFMAKTLDRKKIVLLLCRTDSRIGGGSPRDPFFPGKSHSLQSLALFWPKKWGFMQKCSQQRSCHMQQLQRPPHPQPHPGPHPGPPHPHYPVEWKDVVVWSSSSRGRFEKAAGLDSIHIWENEREREREWERGWERVRELCANQSCSHCWWFFPLARSYCRSCNSPKMGKNIGMRFLRTKTPVVVLQVWNEIRSS